MQSILKKLFYYFKEHALIIKKKMGRSWKPPYRWTWNNFSKITSKPDFRENRSKSSFLYDFDLNFLQKCSARCALTNSSKKPHQKSFFPRRNRIFSKKSCFRPDHLPDHFYKVFEGLRAKISSDSENSDTILGIYVKISKKKFSTPYAFSLRNPWTIFLLRRRSLG